MGQYTALVEDHLILPAVVRLTEGRERLLRTVGRDLPGPVRLRLLIDTGAKRTTLVPGVIHHLSPPVCAGARVITPLAVGNVELFWVRLEFPEGRLAPFEEVAVARLAMPPALSGFHGLLGR